MPAKRVLILDTGKEWGGGTNSLLELLKRFVPEGSNRGIDTSKYHFTALFYNNYKKGNESDIKTEIEKLGIDFFILEQQGQSFLSKMLKEIIRVLFFFGRRLKKYFIFLIDYKFRIEPNAVKIAEILKSQNVNMLYMNNQPSSNLEGIIAGMALNLPCIQHSRVDVRLNKVEADAVNNCISKVICVSNGVRDSLVSSGVLPEKCIVVYNGIDPDMKPITSASAIKRMYGINDNEILIGTVGSLIKRKRINDLIKALDKMQTQEGSVALYGQRKSLGINPNVTTKMGQGGIKCMIVGDGTEKENLQREVLRMGLQDRVIFTGFQTDAISYVNAMDIFVLPSENEGLPRVILEAMLMAKPVVAYNVTGPSELVVDGETGFLVSVKETDMFANALSKLVASDNLRRGMGEKGRMRVIERFAIDKYVNGVSNIFEEVLG
ncbi:MAG: hypothetical protein A3G39_05220 [Deltaproteobacteria bacterium RIFCSPLOWO2_12_FULL_43_16]|nr:MAG: hypothetical protein A2Z89_04045 [Deltaproteobacteria bacterium GWA2_43_19]OGQ09391.1 MAG: hypothetical protein A3D30_01100 [Deltaproteobacteria bacterium RIFCSPHIGHO2_02_FULL_43_33]OGQ58620.1 MAG: hypothetical protein A3G39_05220 [Deltaproteobacteria bacterium RIFCSPLOWO2_12_FULL_43_16]HBR16449.1 hypothetical protein [Deltaproteobacteria bacterium]